MKHVIEVTADDISLASFERKARLSGRGGRLISESCPIALAARRAFQEEWVSVGDTEIEVGSVFRKYGLPSEATRFIQEFDIGGATEPFSFEVEG